MSAPSESHDHYMRALEVIADVSGTAVKNLGEEVVKMAESFTLYTALSDRADSLPQIEGGHPMYAIRLLAAAALIEAATDNYEKPDFLGYHTSPLFGASAQKDGSYIIDGSKFSAGEIEQLTRDLFFVAGADFEEFNESLQRIAKAKQTLAIIIGGSHRHYFNTTFNTIADSFQLEQTFITNEKGDVTHITLGTRKELTQAT